MWRICYNTILAMRKYIQLNVVIYLHNMKAYITGSSPPFCVKSNFLRNFFSLTEWRVFWRKGSIN